LNSLLVVAEACDQGTDSGCTCANSAAMQVGDNRSPAVRQAP
jgi:hypothetical protein